jgi:tetratricopeptide (TPR) repeat protein
VAGDGQPKRRWSFWKILLVGVVAAVVLAVGAVWWALGPAFYHALPGVLAEQSGDYDSAIRHYLRIVERKPNAFMMAHDIACCYARKGDREQALRWLRRALESSYGDYARDWALTEEDFDSIRDTDEFRALLAGGRR